MRDQCVQDVMARVRNPSAGQRFIKIQNITLALKQLEAAGFDLTALSVDSGEQVTSTPVTAENVMAGHSREVLALLWAVATEAFSHTLPLAKLQTEVALLERKLEMKGITCSHQASLLTPGNETPVTKLLMRWVSAVAGLYGVTIRSCSTSFTDGSALCLLVHHYVPSLVSWSSITVPPPVPRDLAQALLRVDMDAMESLSWADWLGLQGCLPQGELEQYRCADIL